MIINSKLPECLRYRIMITSITNQQMKNLIKLIQKPKERRTQRLFVAEGVKMFLETPKGQIEKVYVSETYYNKKKHDSQLLDVPYEIVQDNVFNTVSDTMTPQGILCLVRQPEYEAETLLGRKNPCFLLLEDIQDPGNLGTIIRTAEAAGVDAVIMSKGCVDLFNPKVIRSTMGAVYRVPYLCTDNLGKMVSSMKERGIRVFAAHLQDSVDYDSISYLGGCAFLIGNEGNGLSDSLARAASSYIKIPMEGRVESLNAAVAASVLVYEVYRQRRRS